MKCTNCAGLGRWCIGPWDDEQSTECGICGGTGDVDDNQTILIDQETPVEVVDAQLRSGVAS